MFSTLRSLPLLPSLLASPVVTDLHWSPLVHSAAQRNLRAWGWVSGAGSDDSSEEHGLRFRPRRWGNSRWAWIPAHPAGMEGAAELSQGSTWTSARSTTQQPHASTDPADISLTANTHATLPRLLALHLRRGDFEGHCVILAYYNATWQGINADEGVVDP
jgi:hypothetical protein